MPTTFKINDSLELKLEEGKTNIYVDGNKFTHCKYLLINIPKDKIEDYDEFNSIDEIKGFLDNGMEKEPEKYEIPTETEFWAHCSNLQAWVENGYNTDILEMRLAFPLLKELSRRDPRAGQKFREELVRRLNTGYAPVQEYLFEEHPLELFSLSKEEADCIESDNVKTKIKEKLENLMKKTELSWGWKRLGEIPRLIEILTNLEYLYLQNNKIQKIENLDSLPNLEYIYLNNNQIQKIENLETFPNLEILYLQNNKIQKIENLETLPNLKTLDLHNNQIQKIENLETFPNLEILYLHNNKISRIENLETLTNLEILYLHNNKISRIENLETLTNLKYLYLHNNKISRIENLETLTNLKYLYLSSNQIKKIEGLETLTNLETLFLDYNKIKPSEIKKLREKLPDCFYVFAKFSNNSS